MVDYFVLKPDEWEESIGHPGVRFGVSCSPKALDALVFFPRISPVPNEEQMLVLKFGFWCAPAKTEARRTFGEAARWEKKRRG